MTAVALKLTPYLDLMLALAVFPTVKMKALMNKAHASTFTSKHVVQEAFQTLIVVLQKRYSILQRNSQQENQKAS